MLGAILGVFISVVCAIIIKKIVGDSLKTEKNILIAFILNFAFSVFEILGGFITGSVAIISDAVHDLGDAASIGVSYFLEKKSKKQPDALYTYGYTRYSVIASVITTLILLFGSLMVIYNAVGRIVHPVPINYNGMIVFAIIGVCVNATAAFFTREGDSLNQKAVNLHMLEDVLGWAIVLVGSIVMRFTDFALLDPLLSVAVAAYILIHAVSGLKEAMELFLEKTPEGIDIAEIKEHLLHVDGVLDVHHIHVWSMDGMRNYATMHIMAKGDHQQVKRDVRAELLEHGIAHATLELENENEQCYEEHCHTSEHVKRAYGHHHHHH